MLPSLTIDSIQDKLVNLTGYFEISNCVSGEGTVGETGIVKDDGIDAVRFDSLLMRQRRMFG